MMAFFAPSEVKAEASFDQKQIWVFMSFDDDTYVDYTIENSIIYVEAKNDRCYEYLINKVEEKEKEFGLADSKVQILKPIEYSQEELEAGKIRLLTYAEELHLCKVEVDDNELVCSVWKGEDWTYVGVLREISEISHVRKKIIKKPKGTLTNENDVSVYSNLFDITDEDDKSMYIDAGRILKKKDELGVDGVIVKDYTIYVTVLDHTAEKEEAIKAVVEENKGRLSFISRKKKTDLAVGTRMNIQAGKDYATYKGTIIEFTSKPYMKNGYIMIPMRDVCQALSDYTIRDWSVHWSEKEKGKFITIENTWNYADVTISVDTNEIVDIWYYQKFAVEDLPQTLEGNIEIIDGTVYLPYSKNNFMDIFYVPVFDPSANTLSIVV